MSFLAVTRRSRLVRRFVTLLGVACVLDCESATSVDRPEVAIEPPPSAITATSGVAPAAVSTLAVVSVGDSSAALSFTEVDDGTGQPASYDVRFAVAPLSWGTATSTKLGSCATPVAGTTIGAVHTCTVLGLVPGTRYNFELVPFRGTLGTAAAVFGPLSNIVAGTTTVGGPVSVASVVVTPATVSGTVGQTAQLTATTKDASGNVLTGRTVTWASSNTSVATVSATGLVSELAVGTSTVTATSEGKTAQAQIAVSAPSPIPVATVAVSPTTATIAVGAKTSLSATLKDAAGNALTGRAITWSSASPSIALVDSTGVVTGVAAGTASVTATSEGQSGQALVTVTAPLPAPVTDLTVSSASDSSATLSFTETNNGTGQPASYDVRFAVAPIAWSSATSVTRGSCSTPVAGTTVGARRSCTVLGLAAATSYQFQLVAFRGTLNTTGVVLSAPSNVASTTTAASVATVVVTPATVSGVVGQTAQLTATAKDVNGNVLNGRTVTWSSSNNAVAAVSSSGRVSELAIGNATITATSEGQSGQAQIGVAAPAPAPVAVISISPATATMQVSSTFQLVAQTLDASGNVLSGRTISWVSANAAVATVSATGLVTALAAGSVAITATSEGKSTQAQITVSSAAPPPTGGEPVDPGSGYLWSDDFDRYASVLAMESPGNCPAGSDGYGVPDGFVVYGRRTAHAAGNAAQACTTVINAEGKPTYELITGRNGTGKALRGNVVKSSVSQGGIDWLSPWGGSNSSFKQDPTKAIVIQFWVRMSPGGHVGPVGGKYLLLWVDNLGGPARDRIQYAWTGSNPVVWRPQDGPNTSGFYRTPQPVGPYANPDVNDGQWHRMTQLYKPNSWTTYQHVGGTSPANEIYNGSSSRDGRIAMWVDGVKVMDVSQATVGVTPPGGTNPWCYQSDVDWIPHAAGQYLEFPSVINDSGMSWTIDHDDLKVWQF